ncbi:MULTISPECIES: alpha/beta hydrolase [unclassified Luteibacter]|uniref:alpha/beta fold hydrolase n=1 Tax=unclassified Luteibacter TaxID=2620188 RepID=UPI0008C5121F|nr:MULTISPECIES: alpha/beta hydrolase [unclassified Luteibacter]MDR6937482.1 pimeloyl-ACP methyl ester carboxylesterase [Luteibacter sp. 3190]SEO34626.1 Pimeloyl-ACP methyl ester carboxylesterase [Luteibacter sp. UNC138MFCol5.1]SEW24250.1 Pimeloyl-ACP methyl ester carboxylesterase [Luteibacter sp. 329MFSha]
MTRSLLRAAMVAALAVSPAAFAADKPTVVLVHGALADASSWSGVIEQLHKDGYTVIAAANPLRSVKTDAASIADVVKSVKGPVVLVGHSYGGSVITEAAEGQSNVKSLVYVAAFSPDVGESAAGLSGKFPGSTLGSVLTPVPLTGGGKDLYVIQDKFPEQFAADVPKKQATIMAAEQRPITEEALNEAETAAAWKHIPSWHIYGSKDKNIPPASMKFMAERAKSKETVVVEGASHVVMISHPDKVAKIIEDAAK